MKQMLFAGAMMLAATGSTLAADLPPSMPPPPPRAPAAYIPVAPPMYNWGGIYIGLNGGYGFGKSTWTVPAADTGPGNISTNGPLVGGTLGANFQTGQFVFGIEGDGDWSNIKGSTTATNATGLSCVGLGVATTSCTYQTTNTWLATLRARMGVAWDRVLIYATAGGAGGNIGSNFSATGITTASSSNSEFGWTAGGGLEFGITDNVTAKVEYLYVDLQNSSFSCPATTCVTAATGPVSFTTSLVRAGLNLKFNPF